MTEDFVLVHVPKTGGTFLNELIRRHCEVLYERTHAPYSELPADYQGLPAVAFVRNPFEWYVSWFEHYQHFGPDTPDDWAFNRFEVEKGSFRRSLHACFQWPVDYYSASFLKMTQGCDVRRFETLREDFVDFLGGSHPKLSEAVLRAPATNIGKHAPYRSYYTEKDALLVQESWVTREYGYEFLTAEDWHWWRGVQGWVAASTT